MCKRDIDYFIQRIIRYRRKQDWQVLPSISRRRRAQGLDVGAAGCGWSPRAPADGIGRRSGPLLFSTVTRRKKKWRSMAFGHNSHGVGPTWADRRCVRAQNNGKKKGDMRGVPFRVQANRHLRPNGFGCRGAGGATADKPTAAQHGGGTAQRPGTATRPLDSNWPGGFLPGKDGIEELRCAPPGGSGRSHLVQSETPGRRARSSAATSRRTSGSGPAPPCRPGPARAERRIDLTADRSPFGGERPLRPGADHAQGLGTICPTPPPPQQVQQRGQVAADAPGAVGRPGAQPEIGGEKARPGPTSSATPAGLGRRR